MNFSGGARRGDEASVLPSGTLEQDGGGMSCSHRRHGDYFIPRKETLWLGEAFGQKPREVQRRQKPSQDPAIKMARRGWSLRRLRARTRVNAPARAAEGVDAPPSRKQQKCRFFWDVSIKYGGFRSSFRFTPHSLNSGELWGMRRRWGGGRTQPGRWPHPTQIFPAAPRRAQQ